MMWSNTQLFLLVSIPFRRQNLSEMQPFCLSICLSIDKERKKQKFFRKVLQILYWNFCDPTIYRNISQPAKSVPTLPCLYLVFWIYFLFYFFHFYTTMRINNSSSHLVFSLFLLILLTLHLNCQHTFCYSYPSDFIFTRGKKAIFKSRQRT